jgi:hypothetical protein
MSQPANSHAQRVDRHLDQARRNYALYQQLLGSGQNLDWALTCLYYTAVHLVEAYGASRGYAISGTPDQRKHLVGRELPAAYGGFDTLHNASSQAKYKLAYPDAVRVQRLHDRQFEQVRKALAAVGISI